MSRSVSDITYVKSILPPTINKKKAKNFDNNDADILWANFAPSGANRTDVLTIPITAGQ